jgi:hypothetical protein
VRATKASPHEQAFFFYLRLRHVVCPFFYIKKTNDTSPVLPRFENRGLYSFDKKNLFLAQNIYKTP